MMGFDLHAALLLLLAFALGGGLALLVRRRAEQRRTAYLAQAALMSLDEDADEDVAPVRATAAAPETTAPETAAPENDAAPETAAPDAPRARSARSRRAPAPDAAPPQPHHVPHDMVPLAPSDPELPLGLPDPPPAAPKPKRPRTRPAAERAAAARTEAPAAGTPVPSVGTPPPLLGAPEGQADDLKRLKGIGPQNEQKLNALGIYHWRQIAAWSPEEVRWVGAALAFPGRIEREAWVAQARALVAEPPPEA